jgi:hypothetical protein
MRDDVVPRLGTSVGFATCASVTNVFLPHAANQYSGFTGEYMYQPSRWFVPHSIEVYNDVVQDIAGCKEPHELYQHVKRSTVDFDEWQSSITPFPTYTVAAVAVGALAAVVLLHCSCASIRTFQRSAG